MSHLRTSTPICAIDTYTTSPLSNSIVAPQPAVSLDLQSFDIFWFLFFHRDARECQFRLYCQAGKGYVLGVNSNHWFASWGKPQRVAGTAEEIAKTQRRSDWRRLSAGAGTKGPRL